MAAVTTASTAARGSSARPRLVCTTTPVALMTRRSDGVTAASKSRAIQGTRAAGESSSARGRLRSTVREDLGAQTVEHRAYRVDHERARVAREQLLDGRLTQHLVDGRQRPQPLLAAVLHGVLCALALTHLLLISDRGARRRRTPARIIANATTPKANHQSSAENPDLSSRSCFTACT